LIFAKKLFAYEIFEMCPSDLKHSAEYFYWVETLPLRRWASSLPRLEWGYL